MYIFVQSFTLLLIMSTKYSIRYAAHPDDVKKYDTSKLRSEFHIDNVFEADEINLVYSMYDRYIVGGAFPLTSDLELEAIDPLKADYFLERRELGIINVGGTGQIQVDDEVYTLEYKEALYIGKGKQKIIFKKGSQPLFYINSAPAHEVFETKKISKSEAEVVELGSLETSNERTINKMIVNSNVGTNQLQMGITELKTGSVWNTMPAHVHDRRMEAYFYFEVPEGQVVSHFMGQTDETRHIFVKNNQAVLSPSWSIHCGAGTSNYSFIWGMAGENLDYGDMDVCPPDEMK